MTETSIVVCAAACTSFKPLRIGAVRALTIIAAGQRLSCNEPDRSTYAGNWSLG